MYLLAVCYLTVNKVVYIAAYRRANGSSPSAWSKGRQPSGAVLHSSRELGELMHWRLLSCRLRCWPCAAAVSWQWWPDCTAHPNCLLRKSQLPSGSSSGLEPVATRAEGQWH